MKTKLLILFLLLLAPANDVLVQEIPDCMCPPLYWVETSDNISNYDSSLVIDTCGIPYWHNSCDSILWDNWNRAYDELWKKIYATKFWNIRFEVDAFGLPVYDKDTSIYVTWEQIDTTYHELRAGFEQLESQYGNFILIKANPDINWDWSFILTFSDYQNVLKVSKYLQNVPDIIVGFGRHIHSDASITKDFFRFNNVFKLSPNPASEYIEINVGERHAVPARNEQIQIFDIYGKRLFVGAIHELTLRVDISGFPIGIYFVRYRNAIKSFVKM